MTSAFGDLNGSGNQQVWLSVSRTGQDINGNYSSYSWELRYYGNGWGSWTASTLTWSVNMGGVTASGSFTIPSSEAYQTYKTIGSGSFNHNHASDGTFPAFGCTGTIDGSVHSSIGSGSASFTEPAPPTIPRTSVPTWSGGSSSRTTSVLATVNTNRMSTSFTHTASWAFGSLTGQTGGLSASTGITDSFTWTPPESMLLQIPTAVTGTGTLTVTTKSGSTTIGSKTLTFTLTAATSVKPTITSVTFAEQNAVVTSTVGAGIYVEDQSKLRGTVNATVAQGAAITTKSWSAVGKSIASGGDIDITASGTVAIGGAATDARGRTGSYSSTIAVLPYADPLITSAQARRATSANVVDDNGTYIRIDVTASVQSLKVATVEKNAMTIKVSTRSYGTGTWTLRSTLAQAAGVVSVTGYNFLVGGGGIFTISSSYEILIEITDKFGTSTKSLAVATSDIFMHWSKTGVGIGKYHEAGRLDVDGNIYARSVTGSSELYLSGADDTRAVRIHLRKNGLERFQIVLSGTESGGSNTGSDLQFFRYDDTGTYIANALTISRANGGVTFAAAATFSAGLTATTASTFSSTVYLGNTVTSAGRITSEGKTNSLGTGVVGYSLEVGGRMIFTRAGSFPIYSERDTVGGQIQFYVGATASGYINVPTSGGTPAFAAASDYRAKEKIEPVTDAIERMRRVRAVTFHRLANPDKNLETGFIAHELALVQPDAVIGKKDAVDEHGDPVYQEVMEAKLIPLMAQAIRDLIEIVSPEGEKVDA